MGGAGATRRAVLGGGLAMAALGSGRLAAQAPARPVTIANAAGSVNVTMQQLMKQQRYLEEFGLAPELMHVSDGTRINSGIIGGDIDLTTMSGFAQVFPAVERGAQLKLICGAALLPSLCVFTAKPEVRTLKDLEGRTVGTGSLGSLLHQLMVGLFNKYGVDSSKVKFVNIGASVDVFKATAVGTVDAGTGENAILEQLDDYKVRLVEHGNMAEELPEYTYQGGWTSQRTLDQKRDTVVRALAAYAKLYRFVQMPEAQDAFLRARRTVLPGSGDREGLAQWHFIQRYKPFAVDLVLGPERLDYMQKLNLQLGTQKQLLPYDRVADSSVARDALSLLA
ncbi:ABC transporter substrate-binding protein [Roseomonas elaeocarpi]|uniref:ABC transporter substrate-binding protein n=1 Tax=Roseomonas elaeocarpi TaxID=907779 RepID=A0ABV6K045_9PROT